MNQKKALARLTSLLIVATLFIALTATASAQGPLFVSPTNFNISGGGGAYTFIVTNYSAYPSLRISSKPSWVTITQNPTVANRGVCRFTVSENTGGPRKGTIMVEGRTPRAIATRTVNISQAAGYALSLSPMLWKPSPAASSTTISVVSNTTWSAPTSNVSWLTITSISPSNRNGNGSFRINASPNNGAGKRSGIITVTANGITRTVTVTQDVWYRIY